MEFQTSAQSEGRTLNAKTVAQEQLWIYLRIFVLMGVSWLSEAVHAEVHENHDRGCSAAAEVGNMNGTAMFVRTKEVRIRTRLK